MEAAGALAYLNGRFALTYDWPFLSSIVLLQLELPFRERRDDLNLFYALEYQAQTRPSNTWIIFEGEQWTYGEAYEIVLKYGTWLKSKGVEKDEIVAMDFVNSNVFIWIWFGLWSIGAKPAFINYNLTGAPLIHTIKASSAKLVLVDEQVKDNFAEDVMAEHGFASRPTDNGLPEGRQARYGFDIDPNSIPRSIRKQVKTHTTSNKESVSTLDTKPRKLEIIFFDKRLETYISTLEPIRQPNSERSNQKRNSMAMLIYTSGTTGLPKAAIMSWQKATIGSKFISRWIPLQESDVMYTSMPLYHASASVIGVGSSLHNGSAMAIGRKFSHKAFWPEVQASKATIIQYVGETCRYLLSAPPSPNDKIHHVRAAFGNGLRPDIWEAFKDRFNIATILEIYAATEAPTGLWNRATNSFSSGAVARNGTFANFMLKQGTALIKIDSDSKDLEPLRDERTGFCITVGPNEPGELLYKIDADNISQKFQGYFGNDKATNSKVLRNVKKKGDAYFRTGDSMRCDEEGRWWFVDRLGDTFRWKAENVSTAEVADAVAKHDAVEEANVLGVEVPRHDGRAGCAVVKWRSEGPKEPTVMKGLAEHLKKSLPAYAVPLFIRITKHMHTTGTNKQQKHLFQKDGIDVQKVEEVGDILFWLKDGTYERFTSKDLERIEGGGVRL
ncbi:hypothetical protein B0J11DRAFT_505652 [Dendryphion nanum]|uniref:Very long-chain fatty acid transport protein n=1 Tax=Dendryphion nanum TaxID=256645 RepID=A0A9P9DVF9_9PLEO|nr:hypothetical protein B0J11DRAFT_505652 [Dendryphion nanum]